jgi:hypothetical protein
MLSPVRLSGAEEFHSAGHPLGFDVLDFWRWSASDLASNVLRGRLAEYLVARALQLPLECRVEWDACDLRLPNGAGVEVKSAAYVQSWEQSRPSRITFGIQPTSAWDATTNTAPAERRRAAAIYIFCLLHHPDRATINPLDLAQWEFFVLPARVLDEKCPTQKTISLKSLQALEPQQCHFSDLAGIVREVTAVAPGSAA